LLTTGYTIITVIKDHKNNESTVNIKISMLQTASLYINLYSHYNAARDNNTDIYTQETKKKKQ